MTKGVTIELDSYRLAQMANQLPCYICGAANMNNGELCHDCFAPLSLARQAAGTKVAPRLLATLGPTGVGKTVYLGMLLDMLSRQPGGLEILARGAYSMTLQQLAVAALVRCEFPNKTPNDPDRWNWVHCQLQDARAKRPVELVMPDLAGEGLVEEVDHPGTYKVIGPYLRRCAGALVLVDAVRLKQGTMDQDYLTLKVLSYLTQLAEEPKTGWRQRPVALIFSKADQADECFESPESFARQQAPRLWDHCRRYFPNHRFFASGVVGSCAVRSGRGESVRVPLRVEPRGITEPFEWLVGQLKA